MTGPLKHRCIQHTGCQRERCPVCEGGLCTCEVCGGSEGELPKHCPGAPMTEKQRSAVMDGSIDFQDGAWLALRHYPGGAPMFDADGMMLDEAGNRSIFDDIDEGVDGEPNF